MTVNLDFFFFSYNEYNSKFNYIIRILFIKNVSKFFVKYCKTGLFIDHKFEF